MSDIFREFAECVQEGRRRMAAARPDWWNDGGNHITENYYECTLKS